MFKNIKYLLFAFVVVLNIVINLFGFQPGIDWGDDYAGYIIQAQALESGNFDSLNVNIKKNEFILNYPWGFPIILQPVIKYFGSDFLILKKYVYIYFILSILTTFFLFRRKHKEYALIAAMLMSGTPFFWYFKNHMFADLPALFFLLLSLLLIQRLIIKKLKLLSPVFDQAILGFIIFMAYSIRSQSFLLLYITLFLQVFYYRKELLKKKVLIPQLMPYASFFMCVFLLKYFIPVESVNYTNQYENINLFSTISDNIIYYLNIWRDLLKHACYLDKIDGVLTGIFIILFVVGIFRDPKENLMYILLTVSLIGLLLITPFYQGLRYAMPLVPVYFYFLTDGAFYLFKTVFEKYGRLLTYSFIALVTISFTVGIAWLSLDTIKYPTIMNGPYAPDALNMFNFIKDKTTSQSLIGHWKPRTVLLYGQRNAVVPNSINDCIKRKINYYVYNKDAYCDQLSIDTILVNPQYFKPVYENNTFKIFRFNGNVPVLKINGIPEMVPKNAYELVMSLDYKFFDSQADYNNENVVGIWSNTNVTSKQLKLQSGRYVVCVYALGTPALGEKPICQLELGGKVIGQFKCEETPTRHDFVLTLNENVNTELILHLTNDYIDKKTKEDRNAVVYMVNIFK